MTTKTTSVHKICDCGEPRWVRCAHPWYMKQMRWQGVLTAPNLTRYAKERLNEELTTKTRAEEIAEAVRAAVRAGTHVTAKAQRAVRPVVVTTGQSVRHLIERFDQQVITRDVHKRERSKQGDRSCLRRFADCRLDKQRSAIGDWAIEAVQVDDLIAFRTGAVVRTAANSTWAKYRTVLAQFFEWLHDQSISANLFTTATKAQRKQLKRGKFRKRNRRITEVEEAALLRAAGRAHGDLTATRLQALIVAAIETGMRRGELLALQWRDVDFDARTIYVRAEEVGASKSGHARLVPIVDRLVEELDTLRRRGTPAGDAWPRTAYVFGDAIGGQVRNVKKAWLTAVLVAHGKTPAWSRGALAQASLNDLDVIDLNFHDLRHEAASRWNDSGVVGLAQIQELLGHKAATTTAGYLHGAGAVATRAALQHYDAHRRQAAVVAVAATAGVSGPQKLHKNGNGTGGSASGPRLVRSRKS